MLINKTNTKAYLQSLWRKHAMTKWGDLLLSTFPRIYFKLVPQYYLEQVYIRAFSSKECMENGACLECGCCTKEKIFSDIACEKYYSDNLEVSKKACYGEFISEDIWNTVRTFYSPGQFTEGKQLILKSKCKPTWKLLLDIWNR
jgi:hypothetical protein